MGKLNYYCFFFDLLPCGTYKTQSTMNQQIIHVNYYDEGYKCENCNEWLTTAEYEESLYIMYYRGRIMCTQCSKSFEGVDWRYACHHLGIGHLNGHLGFICPRCEYSYCKSCYDNLVETKKCSGCNEEEHCIYCEHRECKTCKTNKQNHYNVFSQVLDELKASPHKETLQAV
jgi:hypothetical protein